MPRGEINTSSIIETADRLKAAYDESYLMHAYQQGLLDVKRDIAAVLFSHVEQLRSTNPTCQDMKAANLVAHNLASQRQPMAKEIESLTCYVADAKETADDHLEAAGHHYLENSAVYTAFARDLAESDGVAIEYSDPKTVSSFVA